MSRSVQVVVLLIAGLALVGFGLFVRLPGQGFFWRAILNAGHVVLFGAVSLVWLRISRELFGKYVTNEFVHYLGAFVGGAGIGIGVEFLQYFGPRDADLYDVALDILGCVAFLGLYSSVDQRIRDTAFRQRPVLTFTVRLACILLLLIGFSPAILWGAATIHRARLFPQICSFESYWENKFVVRHDADLEVIVPPEAWPGAHGTRAAAVTLYPAPYPGITIEEPYPDWRGYKSLCFSVFLPEDTTITLGVRIDDWHHDHTAGDRFTRGYTLRAGENQICIPLREVEQAPTDRTLDLANVAAIWLFLGNPDRRIMLYVDNVRLE